MTTLYLRPTAAGDLTNLFPEPTYTPNWDCVDEVTPDGFGTYVYFVIGDPSHGFPSHYGIDLYTLGDTSQTGTINWIKVWIRCQYFIFWGNTAKTVLKTGGTVYEGAENYLTNSWVNYSTQYTINPQTGVAWTWNDINSLQVGVDLPLPPLAQGYDAQCTQVYVEVDFTPPPVAPTVTTQAATNVQPTSCIGNGNIIDTGGENCTRRGFCYKVGTSGDPTTADSVAYDDGSFGTGPYTKAITGLNPGTGYRVRAYAVNSAGTGYGTTIQVTTLTAYIRLHLATAQRRYKTATFSGFSFPDPAGTGFTAATDGYSMLAGWGLVGMIQMFLSGTLHTTGSLGRKIKKSLEGSLTSSGTVSHFFRFYKVLYGTLNFSGTLSGLRKMVLGGVLNLSGSLNRLIKKNLTAILNLTGALQGGLTWYKTLAGTLNFSGALATAFRFSKSLAGTLNLSGSLIKLVKKNLAGTLNSTGTLGWKIWHTLSGTVNFSGALGFGLPLYHKVLAGTLNLSGNLNRKIRKSLVGTVSFVGTLTKFFATFFVHRYVIEIHDPTTGALIAVLKNAYGITLEETVNAPTALSFRSPADEAKLAYLTRANEIWVRDVKTNTVLVKTKLLRDDDTR